MSLLKVENLCVTYTGRTGLFHKPQKLRAVRNVSFEIQRGEIVGLVGESGCGKSTIGKTIVQLERPESGKILLDGQNIFSFKGDALRAARKRVQMIFQDPSGSLNPRLSIKETIDEILKVHFTKESAKERYQRAKKLVEQVGLSKDVLERYPHQFSGGQRQRIGIARALAAEPDIIVADEPVSALDVSVQAAIVNLLADIRKELGTAFLFIAHDLAVVEHISDRILVMYLGNIVESAPAKELVRNPLHPYTAALLSAVPTITQKSTERVKLQGETPSPLNPPQGCPFHPRCPFAQERCKTEKPPLNQVNEDRTCACFFPISSTN